MEAERFDWREESGILTPVRFQNGCSCCWAIVAAGAIESRYNIRYFKKYQKTLQAAPQHLIDCVNLNPKSKDTDHKGCYTSSIRRAFEWVINNQGIAREKDYPFQAKRGVCKPIKDCLMKIKSYERIQNIDILNSKIKVQPIGGGIRATDELQHLKNNEIYYGTSLVNEPDMDKFPWHAVLIVGFGRNDNGDKYWLIKNSWGEQWGDNGYAKVSQNVVITRYGPMYLLSRLSYPNI